MPQDDHSNASQSPRERWYVAQVQPRREPLAVEHLERQGFATFVPKILRRCRAAKGPALRREALFPAYVFVRFDMRRDRWRSINGTIGVARLVSFGEKPAALPNGFVEALLQRMNGEDEISMDTPLANGSSVRVVGGIFDELTGTILKRKSRERVFVLLDLLSGAHQVELPEANLLEM